MNPYEQLFAEAESVIMELRKSQHSRAAFLIRTLSHSIRKEMELRVSYEKDLVEQRDYLEVLHKEIHDLRSKLKK